MINRLDPQHCGGTDHRGPLHGGNGVRSSTISGFRALDAPAAPVLDEGIDVPDANLGVVMSASRTRRQMIQRMGRILRRKRSGVAACFVIMFAKDTLEDPSYRFERDGFLDEIERISEGGAVSTARISRRSTLPGRRRDHRWYPNPSTSSTRVGAFDPAVDVEVAYASLAFTNRPTRWIDARDRGRLRRAGAAIRRSPLTRSPAIWSFRPPRTSRPSSLPRLRGNGCRRVKWRSRSRCRRRVAHQLHRMR